MLGRPPMTKKGPEWFAGRNSTDHCFSGFQILLSSLCTNIPLLSNLSLKGLYTHHIIVFHFALKCTLCQSGIRRHVLLHLPQQRGHLKLTIFEMVFLRPFMGENRSHADKVNYYKGLQELITQQNLSKTKYFSYI